MKVKNDNFVRFFKALANEDRIEIVKLLKKHKEMCAQEVQKFFYLEQSTTSHHLNTLRRAGITKSRKSGRNVYYTLDKSCFTKNWNEFEKIF